ncbi:MAG: LysM peptidoglycan-binding domain-containing protein, partial [Acidimicrobiia bacterium]|nr:LysM peptidoglycan-binding domain-containing protein [Acidimicrobiia bacterium]
SRGRQAVIDHTVQPGDSFWSLAEQGLGDGFRWREIRRLNLGRVVGDGITITNQTETLQPGWVLRLPGEAAATAALPSDSAVPPGVGPASPAELLPGLETESPPGVGPASPADDLAAVTVDQGDHFWSLAKDRLTAEWGREPTEAELTPYWADMVAHNRHRLRPPGDPDLIHPGQQFEFPPLPGSTVEPPADAGSGDPPGSPTDSPSPEAADPGGDDAPSSPSSSASSANGSATGKVKPGRPVESSAPADDADVPVGLVAISGIGLITAAIGGIIGRSQARRLGARRPGTSPAFDLPPAAAHLITETSDHGALDELDTALRHLGAELAAADLALPDLVGALVSDDSIRLLVATPHNAAPGLFTAEREGMVWVTSRPVPPLDVGPAQNPYPLLVSVGYSPSALLLVDLEYLGTLSLDGGFADVIDVMGTMALQLATSPMADTIEVMCVGFGEELADLERVLVVPSLEAGLARIQTRAEEVANLAEASENTGAAGRALGVGDWTPLVVFDPLSDLSDGTESLLAAANRTVAAGVVAVVTAGTGTSLTMELTEDRVSIPAYQVNLTRRALTRTERTALSTAVDRARQPADQSSANLIDLLNRPAGDSPPATVDGVVGASGGAGVPGDAVVGRYNGAPRSSGPSSTARPAVMVRLLGPLRVEDGDGVVLQFARSATPEFIAYLVHHRDGIAVGRVMNTLWPSTTARRSWIANVHADAGRTLATIGDGVIVTPRPGADDEYHLSAQVGSDLELFRALVAQALALPLDQALTRLTEALTLVEGIPYSNVTSRWPMNEGHWQEATVMVDEAARCVATLALDQFDDPALAEWATAKGLLASPQSVELHRLRLRAAIALDNVDPGLSPDGVFQHYQAVTMADDHRPEGGSQLDPKLVELYESYRRVHLSPGQPQGWGPGLARSGHEDGYRRIDSGDHV